jgi:enamine deaminase RidA (YjgF/YER057c/UK114 family)
MSRHHLFDPEGMAPAVGFSYGALSAPGRILHIAGITGLRPDGTIAESLVEQFGEACRGVARVIAEAGGSPEDLVSITIYTPVVDEYRTKLGELGGEYRSVFGKHFPPAALIGVTRLFDESFLVELVCVAVVPDDQES